MKKSTKILFALVILSGLAIIAMCIFSEPSLMIEGKRYTKTDLGM